jgi:peptidoglycan biosynthesis protein MviN/MurJ (putative lipid II flippase)
MLGVNVLLNIVLNALFIPYYGALAAAYSTVISTMIMSLAYIFYIQRYQIIPLPYLTWGKLLLMTGIYISSFYGLTHYFQLHWILNTGISTIISILFSLGIKLVQVKELKQLK